MTPHALLAPARLAGQPVLRSQTDERLVDLVRAGHDAAFEAIVARYRRPLLRYCGGILTAERSEDAVQQTFVKAYDAMRSDDTQLNLKPWLYRIAHNTALNGLRDKSLKYEPLDPELDGVERPDQATERRQGIREVLAAVQELPTRQRDAIVLRELEGRSYEEIAGALGVTGGAVRQLLNRARTTLRAAATALTPIGLLVRIPFAAGETGVNDRMAEMVGGASAATMAAKLGTAVLVTGAVAGGVAGAPALKGDQDPRAEPNAGQRQSSVAGPGSSDSGHSGALAPGDAHQGTDDHRGRRQRGGGVRGRARGESGGDHGVRGHDFGGDNGGERLDDHRGGQPTDNRGDRAGSGRSGDDRSADRSGPGDGDHSLFGGSGSNRGPSSGGGDKSGPGYGTGSGRDGSGSGGDSSGPGSGSGSGAGDGSTVVPLPYVPPR